jgi:hypothetical protein
LSKIRLILENNIVVNEILSYLSLHNCLSLNNTPIALSAIDARGRVFPQMDETEVLAFAKDTIDKSEDLDSFILEIIENPKIREVKNQYLRQMSKRFSYKFWIDMGREIL